MEERSGDNGDSRDPTRPEDLRKEIESLRERITTLERETTLMASDDRELTGDPGMVDVGTDFFQVMSALRSLYLDQEEDQMEIRRISDDIESGRFKVDMTDLMFRLFIRQEIQTARLKLILLSQKLDFDASLFDQLDDLSMLINDPRYSVHQVIIGWKRFEKEVSAEIVRHGTK